MDDALLPGDRIHEVSAHVLLAMTTTSSAVIVGIAPSLPLLVCSTVPWARPIAACRSATISGEAGWEVAISMAVACRLCRDLIPWGPGAGADIVERGLAR